MSTDRMDIEDKLNKYLELQKEIYDYFEFKEDWVILPIDDRREYLWYLNDSEVVYAESKEEFDNENYYCDEIYTQRFYKKWVYRAKEYTMIMVDTHTDGNKFLAIYDNTKEIKSFVKGDSE